MSLLDNLVSYWKHDEGSGDRVDVHGGKDLTNVNSVGSGAGIIGNASVFDGSNRLSRPTEAAFEPGDTSFTIAFWVTISDVSATRCLIGKTGTEEYLASYDNAADRFQFWTFLSGYQAVNANTLGEPALDVWYFIACGYDADLDENWISVNDTGVDTLGSIASGPTPTAAPLRFGSYDNSQTAPHIGSLDESGYWARRLTSEEITQLYNGGAGLAYPFDAAAPNISYNEGRDWIHVPAGKPFTIPCTNTGGDVPADGFESTGTALPSGVTLDPDTGDLSGDGTQVAGTTSGCETTATNDDGIDSYGFKLVILTHKPIGEFSNYPYQRFDEAGDVGIDGWVPGEGEPDEVWIDINGAGEVLVASRTLDLAIGVYHYKVPFDPADYDDGPVTLDGRIVGADGLERVLPQIVVLANSDGTLTNGNTFRIVDPVGGNDANDGLTTGTAKLTMRGAAIALQTAFGDCGNRTIYVMAGDLMFGWDESDSISTNSGPLNIELHASASYGDVTFDDTGTNSIKGATKVRIGGGFHVETTLDAPSSPEVLIIDGRATFTGAGQISETYSGFIGLNAWGTLYLCGEPVDWGAIDHGDADAYLAAAETKYIVFQDTASFPYGAIVKRNVFARRTSKDTGVQYDRLVQNLIDIDIDATGSLFHADVVHELFNGGDRNLFIHGLFADETAAQGLFWRNGAIDPDVPDCNIGILNALIRKKTGSGWNSQLIRSISNLSIDYLSLVNEGLLIADDVGTPQENHTSYTYQRRNVIAGFTYSAIGQEPTADRNHFGSGTFGTNATSGGTEGDWYTDAEGRDYSIVAASDIEAVDGARTTNHDVFNKSRAPTGGSIGAFADAGEVGFVINYPDSPISADIRDAIDTSPTSSSALPTTWTEDGGDSLASYGLAIDPDTGRITGELTAIGSKSTDIRASNGDGEATTTIDFTIANIAPEVTYGGATIRRPINVPIALPPTSLGGIIPPTGAYALQVGSLPTGLSLDPDTGIISGTPTVLESQTFTIRVTNEITFFDRVQTLEIVERSDGVGVIVIGGQAYDVLLTPRGGIRHTFHLG